MGNGRNVGNFRMELCEDRDLVCVAIATLSYLPAGPCLSRGRSDSGVKGVLAASPSSLEHSVIELAVIGGF